MTNKDQQSTTEKSNETQTNNPNPNPNQTMINKALQRKVMKHKPNKNQGLIMVLQEGM